MQAALGPRIESIVLHMSLSVGVPMLDGLVQRDGSPGATLENLEHSHGLLFDAQHPSVNAGQRGFMHGLSIDSLRGGSVASQTWSTAIPEWRPNMVSTAFPSGEGGRVRRQRRLANLAIQAQDHTARMNV